jgi:O-methyltransferase domain/Dimerisation domain
MLRMINGYRISRAIGVAVELGIPELLSRRPLTARELGAETAVHEQSLLRLLRMFVVLDIVEEDGEGRFQLTSLGEELRLDRLGGLARLLDGPLHWAAWQHLDHSIKTGERGFDVAHGMGSWQYYTSHPADAEMFDMAMRSFTGPTAEAVANGYDFSGVRTVADIGGGDGTLLSAILQHHSSVHGILFDRPDVVERARPKLEAAGLSDRVDLAGGSFFDEVPSGADVYLLKSILHDWDDTESIEILQRCRAAGDATRARVLVVERVLSDRIGPDDLDIVLSDLNMMVNVGGRERTRAEWAQLFERAGLRLGRISPAAAQHQIIEALPV